MAWQLAESGVMAPVGGSLVQVTADNQALLVLPQTTINKNNDQVADTEYGDGAGDFYLRVAYYVSNYDDELLIPFSDLNGLEEGLTFEMGRQYALTLSFAENESGGPISVKFQLEVEEWEVPPATQFIIVYAPNGGIGAVVTEYGWSNTSVLSGNPYATPSSEYSFMDWITHADANVVDGEHYVPGETIADISTDMTLYAQWGGEPAEPVENTSQWTYSYSGAAETFLTPQDDLQIYQKVIIFVL